MLTDNKVKSLKPAQKRYSVADAKGLSIDVMPSGKKSWVLSFVVDTKRKRNKLGEYPAVSLKQARKLADEKRANAVKVDITLGKLVDDWFDLYSKQWSSEKYKNTVRYRLDYITNDFKNTAVNDVSRAMVTKAVDAMVKKGTFETAKRSLRLLSQVFDYGIAHEYTQSNPCLLVANIIPNAKVQNMAALNEDEMPKFWYDIQDTPTLTNNGTALLLANYFAVRPSELAKAKWHEFDFDNAQWIIPAHRMKMRLEHLVPIAEQPMQLLKALYDNRIDDGYLFKNRNNPEKPIPIESMLAIIKRAGYAKRMTTHGFRSLFSTVANNGGQWRADVIERQLAHVKNDVRHVYNRAEYLDERTELMQWWADIVASWVNPQQYLALSA